MPGGALGQQLTNITNRAVIPSLVRADLPKSPFAVVLLLRMRNRHEAALLKSPSRLREAASPPSIGAAFAGDFPMPEDQAAINDATFNLKIGMVPIGFFNLEAIVQSSDVIIPKLRAVTADAAVVIKQAIAQSSVYE